MGVNYVRRNQWDRFKARHAHHARHGLTDKIVSSMNYDVSPVKFPCISHVIVSRHIDHHIDGDILAGTGHIHRLIDQVLLSVDPKSGKNFSKSNVWIPENMSLRIHLAAKTDKVKGAAITLRRFGHSKYLHARHLVVQVEAIAQ